MKTYYSLVSNTKRGGGVGIIRGDWKNPKDLNSRRGEGWKIPVNLIDFIFK